MPKKEALSHLGLLVLRASLGLHMAFLHGLGKLKSFFGGGAETFPDPLNIGHRWSMAGTVAGEFLCALLIALGLGTRFAAAGLAFTMGVAGFVVQKTAPWDKRELALIYFFAALAIFLLGPGKLSFDNLVVPKLFRRGSKASAGASVSKPRTA